MVAKPRGPYDLMPAYKVKTLGQKLYATLIKTLSAMNCGDTFRDEWSARKRRLRDYLVATGEYYPYILHGKQAALRE